MPKPPRQTDPHADPTGPLDPGDPTLPDEGAIFGAMFRALDRALPLVLLPLRLEVRFWRQSTPPELRVRIFPDVVHADGHLPELTAAELTLGQAYWGRCWRTGPLPAGKAGHDAAFAWLAGQLGAWRAAWVARETEPLNPTQAPTRALAPDAPLRPAPLFAEIAKPRRPGGPVRARLLPSRFALVLWDRGSLLGTFWGAEVADDLAFAPGLVEAGDELDGRALLDAQGLTWTYDFEAAVAAGMAIRVNFSMLPEGLLQRGFSRLVVMGVRTSDQQAELESLLTAHRYTHGLDVVAQGTATNATETAAPSISLVRPDLAAVRAAELGSGVRTPPRPPVVDEPGLATSPAQSDLEEGELFAMTSAAAATAALGLAGGGALDRAMNAEVAELGHASAMAAALWPGLTGHYLDALMQVGLPPRDRSWLRDWSTHYVRGGGVLPTLLVGTQPYGLLPVSRVSMPASPVGRVEHLQTVLGRLKPTWTRQFAALARLDPEAGDAAPGAGERAALVSQILGGVPHPTAFSLQRVDDNRDDYIALWDLRLYWSLVGAVVSPWSDGGTGAIGAFPEDWRDRSCDTHFGSHMWLHWKAMRDRLLEADTTAEQLAALETYRHILEVFRDTPAFVNQVEYYEQWEAYVSTSLIAFVQAHADRTEPVAWLTTLAPSVTRTMGDADDPGAAYATYPSRAEVTLALVAPTRTEADVTALQEWLDALAADVAAGRAPDHAAATAHPLLRQLLAWSAAQAVGTADADSVHEGLTALEDLVRTAEDPVGELERLMREAVSTHSHRLDAWYTGIAADRLEGKRRTTPGGIQVGAYGWLEDVAPRGRRASQGYVLAPSPAHATTAAILRSGWAAFGGDAESAGLAVDLSSDRIRRARWLMDGVRKGQDLGALLGARLERRLQEEGLARLIEELREAALRATPSTAPPTAIVDGLLITRGRAFQEAPPDEQDGYSAAEKLAASELATLLAEADPGLSAAERTRLSAVLDAGLDDLDAVADAAVAQTVFSLAEGNTAEATTTLTAAGTGEVAFPRLRVADGRRPATTITHKLLLLVAPGAIGAWPGARGSGRALAAPALEAWLEGVLGDPARFTFTIAFAGPAGDPPAGPPLAATLASVGLAALDVVALAPAGEEAGLGRLGDVLRSWADGHRPAGFDPAGTVQLDTSTGDPSLADLAVAGRTLRALLDDARDLDGRDLAPPGGTDAVSGVDDGELERRLDAVRAALVGGREAVAAALAAGGDLRAPLLALNGFALPGTVPGGVDASAHAAQADALLVAIDARLQVLGERTAADAEGWAQRDAVSRARALRDRLHGLIGEAVPVAAPFTAGDGVGLDATFARPRLASISAATRWLAAAGRVDPGARRLRLATDMLEALGGGHAAFTLGQLPDHPGEGWAAVTRPATDDRSRLCLLATGAAPSFASGPAAGLLLGAWTEVIPRVSRTAALGVHFDSPAARAPQALLLCTAEAEEGYSFELVRDLLTQTLELARLRLVGPQSLGALGQYLPATSIDGSIPAGAP